MGQRGRSFVDGSYVGSGAQGIRIWSSNTRDVGQAQRTPTELRDVAAGRPPRIRFLFPGIWRMRLSPSIGTIVAFTPINEHSTRYYLRFYHRIRLPLIARVFETVMGWSNRLILGQDKRVVVTQTPPNSLDASADRHIEADRAIIAYRKQLTRLLFGDRQ